MSPLALLSSLREWWSEAKWGRPGAAIAILWAAALVVALVVTAGFHLERRAICDELGGEYIHYGALCVKDGATLFDQRTKYVVKP